MEIKTCVAESCSFSAGPSGAGLLCSSCSTSVLQQHLDALSLLDGMITASGRQKMAMSLISGDADVCQTLSEVGTAQTTQDSKPVVIVQPPERARGSGPTGTLTLVCEGVSFKGETISYQWYKDGDAIRRAIRQRLLVCCNSAKEEGEYCCEVSSPSGSTRSRQTKLQMSEQAAEVQARVEAPLREAEAACAAGDFLAAERLLSRAVQAAEQQMSDAALAEALCCRARLRLQLGQWREARVDAALAVQSRPGYAPAHAALGAANSKLDLLSEAAGSWETADLLGGVPNAAREAEACRIRLDEYFHEQAARRETQPDEARSEGPHSHPGWQERCGGGSRRTVTPVLPAALRAHLVCLKLLTVNALDPPAQHLPSNEDVRKQYRRLALERHPDKGGSKAEFQALQTAYEGALRLLAEIRA